MQMNNIIRPSRRGPIYRAHSRFIGPREMFLYPDDCVETDLKDA